MFKSLKSLGNLFLICTFVLIGTGIAQSSSNHVFKIQNIPVDVTADTALAARDKALEIGQIQAWRRLLKRICLPEEFEGVATFSFDQIRPLVQGYEVLRERISPVRYLADLNVSFSANLVRETLFDYGVAFAETSSSPILVLPIFESGGVARLWDNPNRWREVWQNLPDQDGLLPIVVPEGNLADIRDVSAAQGMKGDFKQLYPLMERYGAKKIVIAKAIHKFDVTNNTPILEITIASHTEKSFEEKQLSFLQIPIDDDISVLMEGSLMGIVATLTNSWKKENLMSSAVQQRVASSIPIDKFKDWLSIRSRLEEIGILKHMDLLSLTKKKASVDFWIMGSVAHFRNALDQKQLELYDRKAEFVLCEHGAKTPILCKELGEATNRKVDNK